MKTQTASPMSRILIQQVWDGTQEFTFLTSSQMTLICWFGTHTLENNPPKENHGAGTRRRGINVGLAKQKMSTSLRKVTDLTGLEEAEASSIEHWKPGLKTP